MLPNGSVVIIRATDYSALMVTATGQRTSIPPILRNRLNAGVGYHQAGNDQRREAPAAGLRNAACCGLA
jgi:hypothetical protein